MENNHINELELEKFAINNSNSGEIPNSIESHLANCEQCFNTYKYFAEYYKTLSNELNLSSDSEIDSFIKTKLEREPVQLFLYNPKSNESELHNNHGNIVLAAKTNDSKSARFSTEAVFVDSVGTWMIRVMKDQESNSFLIYLLNENSILISGQTIEIVSEDGTCSKIKTNENGFSSIAFLNNVNWEKVKFNLIPSLISE